MNDYDALYNMLIKANINFSIGQNNSYEFYINIQANDPYESDVLIEFNYDMSLKKVWAP